MRWDDSSLGAPTARGLPTTARRKRLGGLRASVARDRTLKRLLRELVAIGERAKQRRVVTVSMRLRSVLLEFGHDV